MSFDTEVQTNEGAAVAELYSFAEPTLTWRLTTYTKDIVFGGNTYVSTLGSRSNAMTADASADPADVSVELPAAHALAQKYVNGIPMKELLVTITRILPATGLSLQVWQGYVSSLSFRGRTATFRIPSGTADSLLMDIPAVQASRLCNNVLYDGQCQVARASFKLDTTITAISADGRTISLNNALSGAVNNVPWSLHGELLHVASQERRTITIQNSTTQVVLQAPFPNGVIAVTDPITVFAGCDHQLTSCKDKFANVLNFGGHPYLPPSNIFYVGLVNTRYHF